MSGNREVRKELTTRNSIAHDDSVQFSPSVVSDFGTPWTAARLASLSVTNSRSPPKPISIESVMPSNHLILCRPLLLLPSIVPSIRVFSNESALRIRWPKDWSFSFNTMITFYLDKFFFWLYHTSCRVLIPQLRTEPVSSLEVLNSKLCTTRDGFYHILSSNILGGLRVEDLNMRSPLFFNF